MRNNLDRLDKKLTMKGQLEKLNYRRTDERLKGFTKLFYFKNPAEEDEGDDNIPKGKVEIIPRFVIGVDSDKARNIFPKRSKSSNKNIQKLNQLITLEMKFQIRLHKIMV